MSPLPPRRAHDIGFSDAVSDVVDIVKHETSRRGRARGTYSFQIEIGLIVISFSFSFLAKLRGDEYSLSRCRTPTRQERHLRSRMIHPSVVSLGDLIDCSFRGWNSHIYLNQFEKGFRVRETPLPVCIQ